MTKYKGQVASYAPALGRVLSGVSAAALGATTLLTAGSALAGSCGLEVPGIYLCSGPADPINDTSVTIINGAPISVETLPGFGIEPFNSANAIDLFSNAGVTFTDNNESTIISRSNDALRAVVYGGGDVTVTTTGTLSGARNGIYARNYGVLSPGSLSITAANVSGAADDGIHARNDRGTDLSITTFGIVSGERSGIFALNTGSGATTISVAGVSGNTTGDGISATNSGTDLSITATDRVFGSDRGIAATNNGSGALTISATEVTGGSSHGILAQNRISGDLSIVTSGHVSGGLSGILAQNTGSGALSISTASVTGGVTGEGISALNTGTDLSITATDRVIGGNRGIGAVNNGSGALTIAVEEVIGQGVEGISVQNSGSDLTITASGPVQGNTVGIDAYNDGTGALTITTADVTGTNSFGIRAENHGSGTSMSITASGTVTGASDAIHASSRGTTGGVTIDVGDAISTNDGFGINARNYGRGSLVISAANVTGTANNSGISAINRGSDLSITTSGLVTSGGRGIFARNTGTGDLTLSVADVTSTRQNGLNLNNYGANLSVTSTGTISGALHGIQVRNDGSGALTIAAKDVTGTLGSGIYAQNSGTDLSITSSGAVSGGSFGMYARNDGSGALTIATSDVTGTAGEGMLLYNGSSGTDLSITASGTVTGTTGLSAINRGSGALTISSADITGTNGNGLLAQNEIGTDLSVTSTGMISGARNGIYARNDVSGSLTIEAANVSGQQYGIHARNFGSGLTSVTVSGAVSGGTGAGIVTRATSGPSVITLNSGASVSSVSGEAIVNGDGGNSYVILRSGSAIAGAVLLSDGTDALTIEGGADISAATLFDGGDGTQDAVTFSAFNGNFDGALFTNWENLTADNGSILSLDSSAADINSLAANNGSTIAAGEANLSLSSNLQIDATSRFRAGFGGSGAVVVGGDVSNDGLVSLMDGHGGDRLTIGGDLSGSGTVALDVDFDAGTNDQLIVTGDSTGAQQGLLVQKSGTLANLQTYALASVSGMSSASDFRLVNGDFVTKGGETAIVGGAYTFLLDYDPATGEFLLSPFAANGGVNLNPNRAFLAAGVQQFSDQIALGGALRRLTGRTGAEDAETVSRSLIELSSTDQPLFWLNAEGGRDRYTTGDRTNETTSGGLRVGASLPFAEIGNGSLIGGFEFGATTLSTKSETPLADGTIDTDAYDVTLSGLWLADNQLYLDGQVRYAIFDSTTRAAGGQEVDTDGDGYATSIEVGKVFALNNGLNLIPQAQLLYSKVDSDDLNDVSSGATGTVSDGDTLSTRLGLRAEREFGTSVLFGQVDYYHAFDDETSVSFGSDTVLTERGRNNVELTLGGLMDITANTMLFGEMSAQTGFGSSSDDYGVAGQLGFEFRF
ncbi:beta strand repeat-containing protein [Roseibium sp. SCP14]|uniref:beta strand repeat-containing protein n=1 Tax=Roseibium sp. SCP14 TaxID=3141375 RepID=UPI0033354ACE